MTSFNSPLEAFLYWEEYAPELPFLNQPIDGKKLKAILINLPVKKLGKLPLL